MPSRILAFILLALILLHSVAAYQTIVLQYKNGGYSTNLEAGTTSGKTDVMIDVGRGARKVELLYDKKYSNNPFQLFQARPLYWDDGLTVVNGIEKVDDNWHKIQWSLPQLSRTDGLNDTWALHLQTVDNFNKVVFSIGVADASVNTTFTAEQTKVTEIQWWWVAVPIYGSWAIAFVLQLIVATVIYFAKEFRKKHKLALQEVRTKAVRYSFFLGLGLILLVISAGLAGGSPWFSSGDYGLINCCNYYTRGDMTVAGVPSKDGQCNSDGTRQCFFDENTKIVYHTTLLYVYLPAAILSLLLLPIGFWITTVNWFKMLRLLTSKRPQAKITFTITTTDGKY